MEQNKQTFIDALKGIAILGIVMIHCGGDKCLPGILGKIAANGHCGVQLFFLLSAYLTFHSLARLDNGACVNFKSIMSWWLTRLIRLAPIFYLAIVLVLIIDGGDSFWLGSEKKVTPWNVLAHLTFLHGFFPHYINSICRVEWYVGVLVIFYAVAPLMARWLDSWEKAFAFFIISSVIFIAGDNIAGHFIGRLPDQHIMRTFASHYNLFAQLPVLTLGLLLFHIGKIKDKAEARSIISQPALMAYSLLALGTLFLVGQIVGRSSMLCFSWDCINGIAFFCIFLGLSINACPLIDNVIFGFLGRHSFAVYLFHVLINHVYARNVPLDITGNDALDWCVRYFAVLAISLLFSMLLTKIYDRPVRKFISSKLHVV